MGESEVHKVSYLYKIKCKYFKARRTELKAQILYVDI